MRACQIVFFLGISSLASSAKQAENENWLSELTDRTLGKLVGLEKKIGRAREGLHENLADFIDTIKEVSRKVKDNLNEISDIEQDQVDAVMDLFQETVNVFEKGKRNGGRNRRVIKELVDTTKEGISILGTALEEFFEVLKTVKGGISGIALNVQRSVDKAADKLMDSI